MNPAARTRGLRPTPIRALSEGAPLDAIPMGLGEPGWDLPEPARKALAEDSGPCAYGPNAGLPALREAVARFHRVNPDQVFLASGSQGALYALFQAWLDPGDAVLVPDPGFVAYPILAELAGAAAAPYALGPDFTLDPERFREALLRAPRAKLAVLNHPANPTGAGASREALRAVAELCAERGVLLLSDEVYRELHLGERPPSLREVTDQGLVLGSLSKAWGAPGLRVGWALGDPRWLAPAARIHAFMVTAPARPSQQAALALLDQSEAVLTQGRAELRRRWEIFAEAFAHHFGSRPAPAAGGFYHWLPLPPGALDDPMAFGRRLRDQGRVVVVPGLAFGEAGRGFLRLSFGGDPADLDEGLRRLAPFWREA